MGERRESTRQKSFLRGFVYVNKRRGALECLIRDISSQGARIIFTETVTLPDVFDLCIPKKDRSMRVRVQWRRGDEIGLAFDVDKTAAQPDAGALSERVVLLEAELGALRKVLKRLKSEGANENR